MLQRAVKCSALVLTACASSAALGAVGDVYATRSDLVTHFNAPLSTGGNTSPFVGWDFTDVGLNQSTGKFYVSSSDSGVNQVAMFDSTTLAHIGSTTPYAGWDFQALGVNQTSGTVYAMGANQIAAFDGTTLTAGATSSFFTGWGFKDIAVNKTTGDIYVAAWDGTTGQVARFDSNLNHLGSMTPHAGWDFTSLDINQSTGDVYVSNGGGAGYAQIARIDGTSLANLSYSGAYTGWGYQGIAVNQTTGDVYAASEDTGGGFSQVAQFDGSLGAGVNSGAYGGWDFQGIDINDATGDVYVAGSGGQITSLDAGLNGLNTSFSYGSLTGDIVVQQVVPEPASLFLIGFGAVLITYKPRRG